jgi:hypothetical protein
MELCTSNANVSGIGRHNLKKIGDRYFIDRDPRLFRYIMSFLRTHKIDLYFPFIMYSFLSSVKPAYILCRPDDTAERSMVLREFDYFCINTTNPAEDFLKKEWRNTQTLGGHEDIVLLLLCIPSKRTSLHLP